MRAESACRSVGRPDYPPTGHAENRRVQASLQTSHLSPVERPRESPVFESKVTALTFAAVQHESRSQSSEKSRGQRSAVPRDQSSPSPWCPMRAQPVQSITPRLPTMRSTRIRSCAHLLRPNRGAPRCCNSASNVKKASSRLELHFDDGEQRAFSFWLQRWREQRESRFRMTV